MLSQQIWKLYLGLKDFGDQCNKQSNDVPSLPDFRQGRTGYPVWLDIWIFSMSNRIPDIKTIRIPDIRLIFNARYLVICRASDTTNQPDFRNLVPGRISSNLSDIRYQKSAGFPVFGIHLDIRYFFGYPALEISRISGIR